MDLFINKIKTGSGKQWFWIIVTSICFAASMLFVYNNAFLYERSIAKVIEANIEELTEGTDMYGNYDQRFTQHLIAQIKNGEERGQLIHLINEYSASGGFDQGYRVGNELFVSIDEKTEMDLTGAILDVKRDKYIMLVAWLFIITLLLVGKKQGLFSIISLVINAVLLSFALDLYLNTTNISLLLICSISAIIFTIISLLLVNGLNEKTYAAIVATLLGTFLSLLIAYVVMWVTSGSGLRYEDMQFITRHYQTVFMAGVFIGSLGAVMDVAITMSSSIFSLYEQNHKISVKALKLSGMDIGKDIMGTMTNILFFAYISGSIPMLILYFKNASPFWFTLSMNLSLELARALAGGIGIVLTIPIGLYTAIFFVNRKRSRA
ncbi:YibE/F family protein [Bacillus sp. B15-48]|uniref:YibE/F family protein n=1 Tax=Bacillus sp. B15-48 TaxID=1548601 RepID=UPI001940200B|nr:YibE/F family protein [Bacillus sp. B15-48]MBM4761672.1 YibE/F family protein [Bacillus sp. B15-48]